MRTLHARGVSIEAFAVSLPAQTCRRHARRGQLPAARMTHPGPDSFSRHVGEQSRLLVGRAMGANSGRIAGRLTAVSLGASTLEAAQRTCAAQPCERCWFW